MIGKNNKKLNKNKISFKRFDLRIQTDLESPADDKRDNNPYSGSQNEMEYGLDQISIDQVALNDHDNSDSNL